MANITINIQFKPFFQQKNWWVLCFLFSAQLQAAGVWSISPYIETKGDYSSNIQLSQNNRQSSYVGQINPGIKIAGTGTRTQLALDYRLQNLFYSNTQFDDKQYRQGNAFLSYELVDDKLTFYAIASEDQGSKDIHRGQSTDNVNDPDNITNVYKFTSGLRWQQRVKNKASIFLDASGSYTDEQENVPDEKGWDVNFNTSSTYQLTSLFWAASYKGSERTPDNGQRTLLQQGSLQLGPQIAPHLVLYAAVFKEHNDVPDSNVNVNLNSASVGPGIRWRPNQRTTMALSYNFSVQGDTPDYWGADINLTPNPRVLIAASYGRRFYGPSYNLQLSYSRKKTQTKLIYKEGLSSYSRSGSAEPGNQSDQDSQSDDTAESPQNSENQTSPSNAIYLDKNATWSTSRLSGRHSLLFDLFYSERTFINAEGFENDPNTTKQELDYGTKFDWGYTLGPRTSLNFNALYREIKTDKLSSIAVSETLQDGNEWLTELNVNRNLSRYSSIKLQLLHRDKKGTTNVESYIENRIGLYYTLQMDN